MEIIIEEVRGKRKKREHMVCNLAVAITKAACSDERLKALIDEHLDEVQCLMAAYLHRQHPRLVVKPGPSGTGEIAVGDGLTLTIAQGNVTLTGARASRTAPFMEALCQEASALLRLTADQFFAQEVEYALKQAALITAKQTKEVENAGAVQRATMYCIQMSGLKARVFVLPNARVQIFVDTGTFAQAKMATVHLFRELQAQGLPLTMQGDVEQHRQDVDHVHVRQVQRGER
jgi:hypothetical protein